MNTWFLQRLRTMNTGELLYRLKQKSQALSQKRQMGVMPREVKCQVVPGILPVTDIPLSATEEIDVFGQLLHPASIKDWSLDISTNRSFPKKYAQHIDIRTGNLGSAKHVWEVNRMLFLPRLAILYRSTGRDYYLHMVMKLVTEWVEQNPYLTGINWYSNIEINTRLINWFLTWEILSVETLAGNYASFRDFVDNIWLPSIYLHSKYSYEHPSRFSSANNHLISEYAGLFVSSSKWIFAESSRWLQYARAGLEKEIVTQHSPNGINKEEAAEYIQFITDFFLIAMVVGDYTGNPFSHSYKKSFRSILSYIDAFLTGSGRFPKYGDEDDGRLCLLNEQIHDNNFLSLLQFGAIYFNENGWLNGSSAPDQKNLLLLGDRAVHSIDRGVQQHAEKTGAFYPEEGHFFFRKRGPGNREIYCHFNAAKLGYLSIAAHGHADALSFELHVDGQPFLVDPGTYCYHTDAEWRHYFVSTRAHNTIGIAGIDQASFIGPTLWLNHYKVAVLDWQLNKDLERVSAYHNGYAKYGLRHQRDMLFDTKEEKIIVSDRIDVEHRNSLAIEMPFHLHPAIGLQLSATEASLVFRERTVIMKLDPKLKWRIVKGATHPCLGWYSDRFYNKTPTSVIIGTIETDRSLEFTTEILIR